MKRRSYLAKIGAVNGDAWHFLSANANSIATLTQAVGFNYQNDLATRQFDHPSGIVILSPSGKIAKYFFGISFPVSEFDRALRSASLNRVGSVVEEILLYCFHYDPGSSEVGKNVLLAIRIAGVASVLGILYFIKFLFRSETLL
jgi:protein SCO1/2